MNGLTTTEAAKQLGVPPTTLKTWLTNLPIPASTDSRGRRRLDQEALEVLEMVKSLRDEDCGYQTIRRRIEPTTDANPSVTDSEPAADGPESASSPSLDTSALVAQVIEAIRSENDLAEKYARVAHRVGELEATLRERERELVEAREKIALLEAPKPTRPWWRLW